MILVLDTSLHDLSIALFSDDAKELVSFHHSPSRQERGVHDSMLTTKTAELLARAGAKAKDIKRIMYIAGPGSFTGLRIGLSFSKGLAYASDATLVPIPSHVALQCSLQSKYRDENGLLFAYPGYDKHSLYIAHAAAIEDVALVPIRELLSHLTIAGPPAALELLANKHERTVDCTISLQAIASLTLPEAKGFEAIAALEPHYVTPFKPHPDSRREIG